MIKLSKTSKMPGASWSLPAIKSCPGAFNKDKSLVPQCSTCYATEGFYVMKGAREVREHNMEDWKRDEWENEMVLELDKHRYFRWFDSGDAYHINLIKKIYNVMVRTPWVKHWFPTRMYKFNKFLDILQAMHKLDNVVIRASSDDMNHVIDIPGLNNSCVVFDASSCESLGAIECTAPQNDGKCGNCRACWDKSVNRVAYIAHGQKMKKVIRLSLVV